MSDSKNRDGDEPHEAGAAHDRARVRRSWWPGWIWVIPVAALLAVAWFGIRALTNGSAAITITFDSAHGLNANSGAVVYRGTTVGQVTGVALSEQGDGAVVSVTIDASAAKFLRAGTRFWLRGATPSLSNLSSLGAVLSGPTIVMEPGPGKKTTRFSGIAHRPVQPIGNSEVARYEVSFVGDAGNLKRGDPVKLRGFTVGEVEKVGFTYDAASNNIATPVTIALYSSLFHIANAADTGGTAPLAAAIRTLVKNGLRARLDRDPPLIGDYCVTLKLMPDAPAATVTTVNGVARLPVAPGGGIGSIMAKLNRLPVDQIGQNVLEITDHVNRLVAHINTLVAHANTLLGSGHLEDTLVQLDAALTQIHDLTAKLGPQIIELTTSLRQTAGIVGRTAGSANRMVSGSATQGGLKTAIQEITEAARAVRSLAHFLDRNPSALIQGR